MINSRSIADLHPTVQAKAHAFISACADHGIDVILTSTYRDAESQEALYAQGRTAPGEIVTRARGGQSFHQYRVAFDFVPLVNGKAAWNDDALWQKCGELGESVGLEWAGRWVHMKERAHLQFTGGLTLADFQAGKRLED